ncbi:sporulation inhibitor of replication protein SirA [Bacillus sp. CLL-7-23]|uniref:Sporulation inhibitor of replication protein SirA n=1 Tax=Bacillus changyiensis TaxID=3004103 RepID=A0ABT4X6I2_9BACI|nr:sporulation inhibitor of replication protein SirA [Bacillus changyiensis]MDA7027902.1 sporulation inhibitor of replication protein SirA [Bacillus changyiensis]
MERHYYTYLIEEEFASHYFGREVVMFKLFYDYHWTNLDYKKSQLAAKQIEYITEPIPISHIHKRLKMNLSREEYRQVDCIYKLMVPKGSVSFIIKDRYIEILAKGPFEAETVFFEILRKVSPCFLAMDFGMERYGWLNPVKERNFV